MAKTWLITGCSTGLGHALAQSVADHSDNVVAAAEERFGGIDVLVNNAGYGYRGAIEEGEDDAVAALFATNVFGARLAGPGSGYYVSTKAALEGLAFALAKEGVSPSGEQPGARPHACERRARRLDRRLVG